MKLDISNNKPSGPALFNLGFRPFFLGAGIISVLSISLWSAVYLFQFSLDTQLLSTSQWHAHEMIYGYSLAVIAGFLLTAVKNWTGVQTLSGKPLLLLFTLWAMARLLWLFGTSYLVVAGILEALFSLLLLFSISLPIFKAKQSLKQIAILSKLILIITFNSLFYLGALGILDNGIFWGIYGGIYVIIALVLTMGRRVVPFFIEKGVGYPVTLFNSKWLDFSNLFLLLAFLVSELLLKDLQLSAYLALGLFIINSIRLVGWHTPGIWKKSLLWSLYLSFWFITLGFLLLAGVYFVGISKYTAIHALTVGGIGIITMSMMSRVALGHTGRDISNPPKTISYALGILFSGAIVRVIVPLFETQYYTLWIGLSQALWIVAFLIFTITYLPLLIKPRIDGQPG